VLLSFQVANHKSIRDEQTLHMQPVYNKSRPALPVSFATRSGPVSYPT
jgi:hypothetical protein